MTTPDHAREAAEIERLQRILVFPDDVLVCDCCGRCWPDDDAAALESCTCSRFKPRMDWANQKDIEKDVRLVLVAIRAALAEKEAEWSLTAKERRDERANRQN